MAVGESGHLNSEWDEQREENSVFQMHLLQALFLEVGAEHIQTIREEDHIRKTWTSLPRSSQYLDLLSGLLCGLCGSDHGVRNICPYLMFFLQV